MIRVPALLKLNSIQKKEKIKSSFVKQMKQRATTALKPFPLFNPFSMVFTFNN